MMRNFILKISMVLMFPLQAWGWPPTFAPEFTFTNLKIMDQVHKKNARKVRGEILDEWRRRATTLCLHRGCRISWPGKDIMRITTSNGFWVEISKDPRVIEVKAKLSTRAEFIENKNFINEFVFRMAKKLDVFPHASLGDGHISIGAASVFDDDPKLFRNFIVDQENNPQLYSGLFGSDYLNARPMARLTPEERAGFIRVISAFDNGEFQSIGEFRQRIFKEYFNDITRGAFNHYPRDEKNRRIATLDGVQIWPNNRAVRVTGISPLPNSTASRLELRGFRPQKNIEEFLLQTEMLEGRLAWVNETEGLIPLKIPLHRFYTPQELHLFFESYLAEGEMDYNHYRKLMPPNIRNTLMLKRFRARCAALRALIPGLLPK